MRQKRRACSTVMARLPRRRAPAPPRRRARCAAACSRGSPCRVAGDVDASDALTRDLLAQHLQLHAVRAAGAPIVDGHALAGCALMSATICGSRAPAPPSIATISSRGAVRRAPPARRASPDQHRRQRRRPELKSESAEQLAAFGERRRCSASGTRSFASRSSPLLPRTLKSASPARAHGVQQAEHHVALTAHRAAVDGANLIPAMQAGGGGQRARGSRHRRWAGPR